MHVTQVAGSLLRLLKQIWPGSPTSIGQSSELHDLQVLWPRSRTNIFGSNATGLSLPTSDVDLVVSLPPVRNLEPIKEAGIFEGCNGIKETCLQIPIIMLVVEVPHDLITSSASNVQSPKEETTHVTGEQGNNVQSDTSLEDAALTKCTQIDHDTVLGNDKRLYQEMISTFSMYFSTSFLISGINCEKVGENAVATIDRVIGIALALKIMELNAHADE